MTLAGLLAISLYLQSSGQVETVQIQVRVLTAECHPIPGATVTLTKITKEPYPILGKSTTDRNGDAFVPASVNQGSYEVSVELANYTPTRVGPFGALILLRPSRYLCGHSCLLAS
jgi:5-hydroxyisourate hydrolase-like protein (transthyretin family)